MSASKGLVLDANILIRAVFGVRVRELLEKYEDAAKFYAPDKCFDDAQKYVAILSKQRNLDLDLALSVLDQIGGVVERVDRSLYESMRRLPANGLVCVTPRIGRLSQRRCCSNYQSGRKTRISLERE